MSKEHLIYGACQLISLWHHLCGWFVLPVVSCCSKVQNGKNSLWHLLNLKHGSNISSHSGYYLCVGIRPTVAVLPIVLRLSTTSWCCHLVAASELKELPHSANMMDLTERGPRQEKPTISKGDNNFIKQSSRWWNSCQSQLLWAYFRHLSGNEDGIQSREYPCQDSLVFDNCLHHCLE